MAPHLRRAIWLTAALVVLAFGTAGSALAMHDAADATSGRPTAHHATVDHDAAVGARAAADRSPLELRVDTTRLFLLAWLGVLVAAALLARTALRAVEAGARRARSQVPSRRAFVRGPPALAFA